MSEPNHVLAAARAVCDHLTEGDCIMTTDPDRPPCDDMNCRVVKAVRKMIDDLEIHAPGVFRTDPIEPQSTAQERK